MKSNDVESSRSGSFVIGVVCGAAVGAAVGLLLAPKSGSDLRRQIFDSSDRLRRVASDGFARASETVAEAVDDVMARGSDAVHRGKETYEAVRGTNGKA